MLLAVLGTVSHSGHHDSLVGGIVICYTKPFHLFNVLCLLVAASHNFHQDSLVRGIVICCTKFVGTPHAGRVVCPHVERGPARC
jgi:ABC-type microcin C transport system permease subunit YejB